MTWPSVPLSELCSPKQHPTISTADLTADGYPAFGANGQIGFYKTYTHEKTTIAITCRGATCGTVNIVPGYSYISGNAMALDKLNTTRADLGFLVYALRFRGFSDVISGSAQPQITRGPLLDVRIPLPPLPEQCRIAAILDQVDELRRTRRASQALLDKLPLALFLKLFGDPASNPLRFEKVALGEIIEFIGGSQPPKSTFLYEDGPDRIRFVQIRDFRTDEYRTYVPAHLAKRPFTESDVMIGRYGPPVFQIFRGLSGTYNVALMKAAPRKHILNDFVFYLLQEPKLHSYVVANSERTAGQSGVNLRLLENYPAFRPPLELQKVFSAQVKEIEAQGERLEIQASRLDALFDSLQHRAFSGQLTARQAERELELAG